MGIIRRTLTEIERKLNEFFRNRAIHAPDEREEWVVLSNIADHEGLTHEGAKNKVVMFLANIQHETTFSTFNRTRPMSTDERGAAGATLFAAVTPPIYINLFVLFFANFYNTNYKEGLSAISTVISFFQQYPVFTHQNTPGLDSGIDKLTFELSNLDLMQLNHLMGMAGTKYLPSVYFKVRMIPFNSDMIVETVPVLKGLKNPTEPDDRAFRDINGAALGREEVNEASG